MNSNPSTNRRPPHEDVVRRFLDRLNNDPQPRVYQPHGWYPAREQLISMKAAEELARWFRK